MGTHPYPIDGDGRNQKGMHLVQDSRLHQARTDVGLIGDHDDVKSRSFQPIDTNPCIRVQREILHRSGGVAASIRLNRDRQDPIAIEEDNATHHRLSKDSQ
jgi:hypothetical protein